MFINFLLFSIETQSFANKGNKEKINKKHHKKKSNHKIQIFPLKLHLISQL